MQTKDLSGMCVALLGLVGIGCTVEDAGLPLVDLPCADTPYTNPGQDQPSEGWGVCEDGTRHRAEAAACEVSPGDCMDGGGECTNDAECVGGPNGRCIIGQGCFCHYGCETDADCAADEACLCNGATSHCIPAQCRTDADCGGAPCVLLDAGTTACVVGGDRTMKCQSTDDTCHTAEDCPAGELCAAVDGAPAQCIVDPQPCADAGRPFTIDSHARVAEATVRTDWATQIQGVSIDLDAALRARIAEHYVRCGLAEHASIASFARFAMQLLAVGAPSDLVADAMAAAADEVEHARVCFGIARVYGTATRGPACLAMDAALDGTHDLLAVTAAAIDEGCIGETLAAAEVAEAARHVASGVLAAALSAIAQDELRHAALAWRFVRWARAQGNAAHARTIDAMLDAAIARATAQGVGAQPMAQAHVLRAHGILPAAQRGAVRRAALRDVVQGCARALSGTGAGTYSRQAAAAGYPMMSVSSIST